MFSWVSALRDLLLSRDGLNHTNANLTTDLAVAEAIVDEYFNAEVVAEKSKDQVSSEAQAPVSNKEA
ncbi:hypothetical protein FCL40_17755 [Ferrimonas sediminicola]|uniref:Uncharacterized protein n=1 Tax=Ferrimonas sediminicola TaxID=2569538 RepID=A0A4V5NUH6_9GAMM|nr:hypothetical protein [Ferrimonas sediminicola]TKB46495.1 hypothetical protein FCL40_17755 [Ferrimonas sediminicola]